MTDESRLQRQSDAGLHLTGQELEQHVQERLHTLVQINAAQQREIEECHRAEARVRALNERLAQQVAEQEGRYRALVQASTDAIGIVDTNAAITFCNGQAAALFGYEREDELCGQNILNLFAPEDYQRAVTDFHTLLERGTLKQTVYTMQQNDGTRFLAEFNCSVLSGPDGSPHSAIGIIHDVTARVQTEEAYHALIDHSLQGLFIVQNQRVVFANAAMSTITGYSLEEMTTMPPAEIRQWIIPDDRLRMQDYLELCLMNPTVPLRCQCRIVRKDGEVRWVESHATVIQYQGQPAIQAANIDITERKQAEELIQAAYADVQKMNEWLRRGRNLLRAIFDNLKDGLLLLDHAGYVQEVNRPLAVLLGGTPEEMVGRPWEEVWQKQHTAWGRDRQPATILEDPLGHQGQQQRVSYRSPDGTTQVLDIRAISLNGPDGRIEQLILHAVDVTEYVQLQSRMIQNERFAASGRLVASVAHEVNTPLQAILTALSLAQRTRTVAERRKLLARAMDEVQRVADIVRQLLDLYRPGMTMPGPVNLNGLIERSLLLTRQWFDEQNVTMVYHLDPSIPTVRGYAHELTQVLLNLLTNARDAMPGGGTLRITTRVVRESIPIGLSSGLPASIGGTLEVVVSDTGCGIDPALRDRIFEPFVTTRQDGTGLGLAISAEIVRKHGGSITVESTPGAGSTFTVSLPLFLSHPHTQASGGRDDRREEAQSREQAQGDRPAP